MKIKQLIGLLLALVIVGCNPPDLGVRELPAGAPARVLEELNHTLFIDMESDAEALSLQSYSTQTNPIFSAADSGDTDYLTLQEWGSAAITTTTTRHMLELADTTNVMTGGTNILSALNIDMGIGNSSGGTNTTYAILIDAVSADPQNTDTAISVGSGFDMDLDCEGDIDINGTSNLDIVDIDGATQMDGTLTVGVSGTSFDVVFHSDTEGEEFTWDESEEQLVLDGIDSTTVLRIPDGDVVIEDDLTVTSGTFDVTAGATTVEAFAVGAAGGTAGADAYFYSITNGDYMFWDEGNVVLQIEGTSGQDALNVSDGNVAIVDDLDVGGTANLDAVDIDDDINIETDGDIIGDMDLEGNINAFAAVFTDTLDVQGASTVEELSVGADTGAAGADVHFYSDTTGEFLFWDASDEVLILDGIDGTTVLSVIDGNVVFADKLNVDDIADFDDDIDIAGDGDVIGDMDLEGNLDAFAGVFTDTLTVTGLASLNGGVSITGGLDLGGDLDAYAGTFTDTLSVTGLADFDGGINIEGDDDVVGNMDLEGNLNAFAGVFTDTLAVTGNADFDGDIDIAGDGDIIGDMDLEGNINAFAGTFTDTLAALDVAVGGGYNDTGCTVTSAGVLSCDGAMMTDSSLTANSAVVTTSATFGGGYNDSGCTVTTAGVWSCDGAWMTDSSITADSGVITNALTVGGGYGSAGCTFSTAGVVQCNDAITTDANLTALSTDIGGGYNSTGCTVSSVGALSCDDAFMSDSSITADSGVITNALTVGGGYNDTGCTISAGGAVSCDGAMMLDSSITANSAVITTTLSAEDLASTDDATVADDLTVGGNVTASNDSTGGNQDTASYFIGLPRMALVDLGAGTNPGTDTVDCMDNDPAGEWTEKDVGGDLSVGEDTGYYRYDTNSIKLLFTTTVENDGVQCALPGADDFADIESVGFWIYSTAIIQSGDLDLTLDDDNASPDLAYTIGAVTANIWTWVEVDTTACAGADCDVVANIQILVTSNGATNLANDIAIYIDEMYYWDLADEEALGQDIVDKGVIGIMTSPTAGDGLGTLAEWTDYIIHYQSGNDFIVWVTDQSANDAVALIAY